MLLCKSKILEVPCMYNSLEHLKLSLQETHEICTDRMPISEPDTARLRAHATQTSVLHVRTQLCGPRLTAEHSQLGRSQHRHHKTRCLERLRLTVKSLLTEGHALDTQLHITKNVLSFHWHFRCYYVCWKFIQSSLVFECGFFGLNTCVTFCTT